MTVHLHIDHLVLDGLGPLDGDAVGAAAQAELSRLLASTTLPPPASAHHHRADGGAFSVTPGLDAERVGRSIGAQIHSSLSLPRR